MKTLKFLPAFLISAILWLVDFMSYKLGISVISLGIKEECFGYGLVTSLGMYSVVDGISPATGFMNVPIICVVGKVTDKLIYVKDNE
jgi:hypothetical protein